LDGKLEGIPSENGKPSGGKENSSPSRMCGVETSDLFGDVTGASPLGSMSENK